VGCHVSKNDQQPETPAEGRLASRRVVDSEESNRQQVLHMRTSSAVCQALVVW
jgi:hypothetical protein